MLRRLRDAVRKKRPDMWTGKNWQLHHDNASAHSARVIKGFLAKNNTALVRQPPYSPHLAPCDFWLFPKLKTTLKGTRFQSCKNLMEKNDGGAQKHSSGGVQEVLPKVAAALGKVCALARGYFEGD